MVCEAMQTMLENPTSARFNWLVRIFFSDVCGTNYGFGKERLHFGNCWAVKQ
jgi:hypothetical protein